MPIQHHKKSDVTKVLEILKDRVSNNDRDVMAALSDTNREEVDPSIGDPHAYLLSHLNRAIHFVDSEEYFDGEAFHSRHPLAALAQEHLSTTANKVIHGDAGDVLPAAVDVFGEGNPIVWAPVMVNILLDTSDRKPISRWRQRRKAISEYPTSVRSLF